ncbi:RNA 2',3'-cyclic phosphodiesterase [Sphingosinicella sp.]|uniref:RNA 2',3'-cyclic phosphodiesterase n=1 Tax=Sphingosinicella sp. TaxID=1917971 RepID=UPI0040377810
MRLFVAIRLPRLVRERLIAAMGGISGARWQSDDQLHLTLRFIGEVDRRQAEDVHAALDAIRQPPFEIALSGVGFFDQRGRPETVWAGVAPPEPLVALHRKVDQALVRVGLEPERRAYIPHITLARLHRAAGPVGGFLEQAGNLASPLFTVERFALFESDLTEERAVYSILADYLLN